MQKILPRLIFFTAVLFLLWGGFPGLIKENIIDINAQTAGVTFGGKIATVIPLATCVNPYTASACINCEEGPWDDITILPIFGAESEVELYACKMATFIPQGGGMCQINEVMFGPGVSEELSINDLKTTNVWCQMQN